MVSSKKATVPAKVLNAFDAYFASQKKPNGKAVTLPKKQETTKKKSLRYENITKICASCGEEYHPTRNGYAQVSKYCSQKCTMDKVRGKFTLS